MNRKNNFRKRQIILPDGLAEKVSEWHGGQSTATYALSSSGMEDLVSLSMIDAAMEELETDLNKMKKQDDSIRISAARGKGFRNQIKDLDNILGDLENVRHSWEESSAQEAGMDLDEDEYEYDHKDYGMTVEEEDEAGE